MWRLDIDFFKKAEANGKMVLKYSLDGGVVYIIRVNSFCPKIIKKQLYWKSTYYAKYILTIDFAAVISTAMPINSIDVTKTYLTQEEFLLEKLEFDDNNGISPLIYH